MRERARVAVASERHTGIQNATLCGSRVLENNSLAYNALK